MIRQASSADWPAIWGIVGPVFRAGETYAVDPNISEADARRYWMDRPDGTFVAELNGRVVGTYYIVTNQPGGGAHVCNCGYAVDPEARGQGLAEKMCQHSQQVARDLGYSAMQFNFVLASNTGALRIWQRLGYRIVGTIPDAYDHPSLGMVDAHVMHKAL